MRYQILKIRFIKQRNKFKYLNREGKDEFQEEIKLALA